MASQLLLLCIAARQLSTAVVSNCHSLKRLSCPSGFTCRSSKLSLVAIFHVLAIDGLLIGGNVGSSSAAHTLLERGPSAANAAPLTVPSLAVQMGRSETVDRKLELLRERVLLELRLHSDLQQLQGMLAPLVAAP